MSYVIDLPGVHQHIYVARHDLFTSTTCILDNAHAHSDLTGAINASKAWQHHGCEIAEVWRTFGGLRLTGRRWGKNEVLQGSPHNYINLVDHVPKSTMNRRVARAYALNRG